MLDIEPGKPLTRSFVATRLNGYVGGYGTIGKFEEELPKLGLPAKVESYVRNMLSKNKGRNPGC